MTGIVPTAHTRRRRSDLQIIERRPSVTKIFDRWTLTLADRDVDLAICDGMGSFVYRDRRSDHVGPWDDHCFRACELAEDPRQHGWIDAEAERRSHTTVMPSAVVGPCAKRTVGQRRFDDYPDPFDLKVAFRQPNGTLQLADRAWKGKTAGIYMLRQLEEDGGIYIGESADIINRWLQHQSQLKVGQHGNLYLQAAWSACGSGIDGVYGFEWVVLEVLPEDRVTWQERRAIEQRWIDSITKNGNRLLNVI